MFRFRFVKHPQFGADIDSWNFSTFVKEISHKSIPRTKFLQLLQKWRWSRFDLGERFPWQDIIEKKVSK